MSDRPLKNRKNHHLSVVREGGQWLLRQGERSSGRYSTQAEAVRAARDMVSRDGGRVDIHGKNDRVRSTFTLGERSFEKISAVEGVVIDAETRHLARSLDGLAPKARRQRLFEGTKSRSDR